MWERHLLPWPGLLESCRNPELLLSFKLCICFWYFAFLNRDNPLFESRRGKRIDFQQEPEGNSRAGAPGSRQCPDCQRDVTSSWDEAWKTWGVPKYWGKGGKKREDIPGFVLAGSSWMELGGARAGSSRAERC